ncbi:LYR motif-containing protein 2 [Geodia barretti]|uniref:LYR motif-containing protein 2 n=1 Tax=Geodia barretti TaxID=519541 RepID=A0AA35TYU5_GEOBA|nr:LYR motif-containing protein 2 [Geodia barretti]
MGPTATSSSFLSLRQFILRREALCLYRQFLRVSRDAGGAREREEMRRWVRGEFDKWRHTTDEGTVRLLLTQGRQSLNDIKTSIEMTK